MSLTEFYGALDEEAGEELDRIVAERRAARCDRYRGRVDGIVDELGALSID
jgi:hypothetical protein